MTHADEIGADVGRLAVGGDGAGANLAAVTAGFDPLLDEGKAYADALREAGVDVTYVCEDGLIHSFASTLAVVDTGRLAMERAAAALRAGLTRA